MKTRLSVNKMNDSNIKRLRSAIVVAIKTNYPGIDYHELLKDWGYDIRLSEISDSYLLLEIKDVANHIQPKLYTIGKLDSQGKYCVALMYQAGWTYKRLRALIIKTAGTTRWLNLDASQQRQIIKILKNYIKE